MGTCRLLEDAANKAAAVSEQPPTAAVITCTSHLHAGRRVHSGGLIPARTVGEETLYVLALPMNPSLLLIANVAAFACFSSHQQQ